MLFPDAILYLWPFAILICFFGTMFSFAERLVLVRSQHYPRWLRTGALVSRAPGSLGHLRNYVCGGKQEIEIFEKKTTAFFGAAIFGKQVKRLPLPAR